jgi:uncharacterized protein involved in outer membrane biogenesis
MALRRLIVIALSIVGVMLLAIVLYLGLADLGRHKGRIEALVTKQIGRPFVIDGTLQLKLFPAIRVLAERVRLGNAEWGSKPQMVEIGRVSTNIRLGSLLSGPVDIRSFELRDVSVLLEKDKDGKGNWEFGGESKEEAPSDSAATEVPAVILHCELSNVEVTYREPGKPDRIALVKTLTITPGTDGLLAIAGKGSFDRYSGVLDGHVGPVDALFAGRNIRLDVQGAIERLQLDINGSLGRLDPLAGANVSLKLQHPDLGKMLENLRLPVVATGPLNVDARLTDADKLTRLDVDAKLGDITAKSNGTLRSLGLPGSDLRFEVQVADAARVAKVFDVDGVPPEALTLGGRVTSTYEEIKLDGVGATLAGAHLKTDGTIRVVRKQGADLRLALRVENLMRLRKGLPELPLSMTGVFVESPDKVELKDLRSRIGKTEINGWASMSRKGTKRVEADLASPRLDLTPFFKKDADSKATAQSAGEASTPPAVAKGAAKQPKRKYVFSDAPIKLDGLKGVNAKLHLVAEEVQLAAGLLKGVDGTLVADAGQLAFKGRAHGGIEGTIDSTATLILKSDGAADVEVSLSVKNLRAGLMAGEGIDPRQVPPTSIDAKLRTSGASARKLASSANGQVLLTQGAGQTKSGLLGMFGGGILAQLASKLNPFSAQDPYTQVDCTVARVDIVDGQTTVEPVLLQSKKVTVTANGKVDLHTEELTVDFNTRPREGIGISPGMFTNPFIKLEGTLASPRIAVGAKGAASGALAAATAGASVVAKGVVDRARGEADMCNKTLADVVRPAASGPSAATR